jgi:hypothetical protein
MLAPKTEPIFEPSVGDISMVIRPNDHTSGANLLQPETPVLQAFTELSAYLNPRRGDRIAISEMEHWDKRDPLKRTVEKWCKHYVLCIEKKVIGRS